MPPGYLVVKEYFPDKQESGNVMRTQCDNFAKNIELQRLQKKLACRNKIKPLDNREVQRWQLNKNFPTF